VSNVTLNLLVLRSPDIERARSFYSALGLQFESHRHASGPKHLSASLHGGGVLEIYPAPDGIKSQGIRLGFRVESVDLAVEALVRGGGSIESAVHESEWGRRAVVADPDGNKVELSQ
jgi:predicted enzyme related to lactoylglutathione lyase